MKLIDNKPRKVLSEGRNYGMGFAMLKKSPKKVFETVQPISPCKDYLNDVIWSEHTDLPIKACGLQYKKEGIFDEKKSYMVISIMPKFRGGFITYPEQEKHTENLKTNLENLQEFINYFDLLVGCNKTKISEIEDNKYLVDFDYKWSRTTWAISLFSLLLRVGQFYKDGNPMKYLGSFKDFPPDMYLLTSALPKLKKFIEKGELPENDCKSMSVGNVHGSGIVTYRG